MKSCENCKYALFQDHGYSNYTVEGTDFHCLRQAHPDGTFDRFYGEDKRLEYGATCVSHNMGEPVQIDCDRENHPYGGYDEPLKPLGEFYSKDPEVIALINLWDKA